MSFRLQLGAAIVGDLDAEIKAAEGRVTFAAQRALREVADNLKGRLRQDVLGSGLRNATRLSTTWQSKFYPNAGLDPAELVFSKAPMIVSAFEGGIEISARGGKVILIPAPEFRLRLPRNGRKGRAILALYAQKYGELRFIPGRNGAAGRYVANVRQSRGKRGGYRKLSDAARRRGDFEEKVVLWAVPKARMPRLLRGGTIRERFRADYTRLYARAFDKYLAQAEAHGTRSIAVGGAIGPTPYEAARISAGLPLTPASGFGFGT